MEIMCIHELNALECERERVKKSKWERIKTMKSNKTF